MSDQPIPAATVARLRESGKQIIGELGQILFVLGEEASAMYLIEAGAVDLFFEPGKPPKRLGAGEFFGELAFIIGNHRRTATAIVSSEGTLLRELGQEMLQPLLKESPADLFALVRRTSAYLVASESQLIHELRQRNKELEISLDHAATLRAEFECYLTHGLADRNTGLFTRRCVLAYLDKLADERRLDGCDRALLLIEIPNLGLIGERLGSEFRQQAVEWVGHTIRQVLRPEDIPFRDSPVRFGVLLQEADETMAMQIARALRERLWHGRLALPDRPIETTAFIGGVKVCHDQPADTFFERAIASLMLAAGSGGEQVAWQGRLTAL